VAAGSYPDIAVNTKTVDFGVALYGLQNMRPIQIENKGAAEARILFQCHHAGISSAGPNGVLTLSFREDPLLTLM
jgi:hypothetical protein